MARYPRDEGLSDILVDQEGFQSIADAGALGLGIDDDPLGHVEIGGSIDEDVADPLVVLDDRDARMFHHETDQALAAAGDDQVDELLLLEHLQHPFPLGEGNHRQGRRRECPCRFITSCRTPAMARLEWIASEPPRRITALPVFRQRAAASAVTLGRAS